MTNPLAPTCVYTILHPDRLSEAARLRGPSTFAVGQRMVTALAIFQSARAADEDVAVLFQECTASESRPH